MYLSQKKTPLISKLECVLGNLSSSQGSHPTADSEGQNSEGQNSEGQNSEGQNSSHEWFSTPRAVYAVEHYQMKDCFTK